MKFLNKFFIGLMALSVSTAILAFCLDQTLLKADFVTAQADKSGIYNDLAQQLPKQISGDGGTSPAIQAALARVVTPEYLQTNLDTYLHNLESAYRTGAAVPPLDLTSIIPKAEALGVQLSAQDKAELTKNLTIEPGKLSQKDGSSGQTDNQTTSTSNAPGSTQIYHRAAQGKWLLVLAALLAALLVFVTASHHRLKALGQGFLGASFWLVIYYAFFRIAPGIADHQLKTAKDFSLGGSVSKLITLAASGVAQRILFAAIATAAVGALLWLGSLFVPHFGTGNSDKKNAKRTPLPNIFHKN